MVASGASSFVLILTIASIAGCVQRTESDYYEVGFPAIGAKATYQVRTGNVTGYANLTVESRERVVRGDGVPVDAVVVAQTVNDGKLLYFVDLDTRDLVKQSTLAGSLELFRLNQADFGLANHFWGLSLREGQAWAKPFLSPRYTKEIVVLEAGPLRATAVVHQPDIVPSVLASPVNKGLSYVYVWHASHLFPDEILVVEGYGSQNERVLSSRTLLEKHEVVERRPPAYEPQAYPYSPVQWDIFPPMSGIDSLLPYEEFVRFVLADTEASSYLELHPSAYAVFVAHQTVQESRSQAAYWYVALRDASRDGFAIELVRRCFSDESLRLVYGDCKDEPAYLAGRPGKGMMEVNEVPLELWRRPDTESLRTALDATRSVIPTIRLTGVFWLAYPMERRDGRDFYEGQPGWTFLDGVVVGEVEYVTAEGGPRARMIEERAVDIHVDGTGWVIDRFLG